MTFAHRADSATFSAEVLLVLDHEINNVIFSHPYTHSPSYSSVIVEQSLSSTTNNPRSDKSSKLATR